MKFREWFNKLDLLWKILGIIGSIIAIGGFIIGILNKEWVKDLFWQVVIFLNDNITLWQALLLILLLFDFFFVFLFWRIFKYKKQLEKDILELKNKTSKETRSNENVEVKPQHKIIWDNLDEAEKEVLRQFKTKNTVEISCSDLSKATYVGLLKNGVIKQLRLPLDGKAVPCLVDIQYVERLKQL